MINNNEEFELRRQYEKELHSNKNSFHTLGIFCALGLLSLTTNTGIQENKITTNKSVERQVFEYRVNVNAGKQRD